MFACCLLSSLWLLSCRSVLRTWFIVRCCDAWHSYHKYLITWIKFLQFPTRLYSFMTARVLKKMPLLILVQIVTMRGNETDKRQLQLFRKIILTESICISVTYDYKFHQGHAHMSDRKVADAQNSKLPFVKFHLTNNTKLTKDFAILNTFNTTTSKISHITRVTDKP